MLGGPVAGWRTSFFCEYFAENNYPTTPTVVGVRTTNAKLIKYPGHDEWTELFDLAADPYETKNLATDPAHRELRARMDAWIKRREREKGITNPMFTNLQWHGSKTHQGPFTSSQQAYDTLHIGSPGAAARLQAPDAAPEPAPAAAAR